MKILLKLYQLLKSAGNWIYESYDLVYKAEVQIWEYVMRDYENKKMKEILIRFNTKALPDDPLVWRVIVDGVEHLASGFEVTGFIQDGVSEYKGQRKWNVKCKGMLEWKGSKAIIAAEQFK